MKKTISIGCYVSLLLCRFSTFTVVFVRAKNRPNRILDHLTTDAVLRLPESDRLPLWEALVDLAAKHRYFGDARWALKPESIAKIDETAAKLAPKAPSLIYRRLFSNRDFTLFEGRHNKDNYTELEQKLALRRQEAVLEIFNLSQITGVLNFAEYVVK